MSISIKSSHAGVLEGDMTELIGEAGGRPRLLGLRLSQPIWKQRSRRRNPLVKTLYDQIGSQDWTQTTAADQPKYVNNNAGGHCLFDGVDDDFAQSDNALKNYLTMQEIHILTIYRTICGSPSFGIFTGTWNQGVVDDTDMSVSDTITVENHLAELRDRY